MKKYKSIGLEMKNKRSFGKTDLFDFGDQVWIRPEDTGKVLKRDGLITKNLKSIVTDVFVGVDGKVSVHIELDDPKKLLVFAKEVIARHKELGTCLTHFNPQFTVITRGTKRAKRNAR